jgi:hypothetical protein
MLMEMAVKSTETAVEAMESMEMAPGALPSPGRVLEQRLLSPKTHRWWQQNCGTLSRKTLIDLGSRLRRVLNRRRGGVRGRPGAPHHPWCGQGGACHPLVWWVPDPPPLRLSFGLRLASEKNRRFRLHFIGGAVLM